LKRFSHWPMRQIFNRSEIISILQQIPSADESYGILIEYRPAHRSVTKYR
jgi:hypothetical protein